MGTLCTGREGLVWRCWEGVCFWTKRSRWGLNGTVWSESKSPCLWRAIRGQSPRTWSVHSRALWSSVRPAGSSLRYSFSSKFSLLRCLLSPLVRCLKTLVFVFMCVRKNLCMYVLGGSKRHAPWNIKWHIVYYIFSRAKLWILSFKFGIVAILFFEISKVLQKL